MPIPVLESQKVLNPPGARFRLTINYHWPLFVAVCQHMQVVFELGVLRREGGGCLEVESVCARGVSLLERCEWTHVHHNRTHPFDGGWRGGRLSGGGGGWLRGGGRFRGGGRLRGGGWGFPAVGYGLFFFRRIFAVAAEMAAEFILAVIGGGLGG